MNTITKEDLVWASAFGAAWIEPTLGETFVEISARRQEAKPVNEAVNNTYRPVPGRN